MDSLFNEGGALVAEERKMKGSIGIIICHMQKLIRDTDCIGMFGNDENQGRQ